MTKDEIKGGIALNVANANVNMLIRNLAELEFQLQEMKEELDALKAKPEAQPAVTPASAPTPATGVGLGPKAV